MDVPPPPAFPTTVTATIDLEFTGREKTPKFTLARVQPAGEQIGLEENGEIDLSKVNGWVVIIFRIRDDLSSYKVTFNPRNEKSLTYADDAADKKRPWRKGEQFSDVNITSRRMDICYTNNTLTGLSSYGITYYLYNDKEYLDPRIKNSAHGMVPRQRCVFGAAAE